MKQTLIDGSTRHQATAYLLVFALLVLSWPDVATAQYHSKKGFQFGVKVGASSYSGDVELSLPGENQYDLTFEGEAFYRFSRWFGVGIKQSFGKYPELSLTESQRASTAIAIRSYLLKRRLSPYIQVGASRSSGGSEVGYGLALATGFELEVSRFFALFQDVSFDHVAPDNALDGISGGRNYDLFGRIGGGIRLNLVGGGRKMSIARVEQPDSLMVGELGQFAAIVEGVEESNVSYRWDLPGGIVYEENPIRHSFSNPGAYEMRLSVSSKDEIINQVVLVDVYRPFVADSAESVEVRQKSARIAGISGDVSLEVGEEGNFRMRIETGAEWPILYEWDMGDGSTKVGNFVAHRFENPGAYRVRGTATNAFGDDSKEMLVEVTRGDISARPTVAVAETSPLPDTSGDPPPENPAVTPVVPPITDSGVDNAESASDDQAGANETDLSVSDTKRTPVAPPNPDRNVSRIEFSSGGYTWVVESLDTSSEAATRAEDYKYLGFPYGYRRDPETGKYNVMVGQFESEWVALKVSWRIQQHAPRRIWLTDVK